MDNKTVSSQGETQLCDHRKVHWALNLEEIMYFVPNTKGNATHSNFKKLKMKARALNKQFERIVEKLSGHCDGLHNTEEFTDVSKFWDELFELYGE